MKILVIGSGVIGLTSAYYLQRSGHEVAVIDRRAAPARETSFANGALLTASMAQPWNAPGCWRVLLTSLGRSRAAMQLRLRALPSLAAWGVAFLRNSRMTSFQRNELGNLRLVLHSLRMLSTLRQCTGIDYGRAARGSLRIFRDRGSLDRACADARRLDDMGLSSRRLARDDVIALEPALVPIAGEMVGGLHYAVDETGDAQRFCEALAAYLGRQQVRFLFNTEITSFEVGPGGVVAASSGNGRFTADRFVVAAGSYSTLLMRKLGVRLPMRPVKGYSVTVERRADRADPGIPIVDDDFHTVVVGLEGAIRVAGTAEFAGYDLSLPPARIRNLLSLLRRVLPREQLDMSRAKPWCGLRAVTTDGVPIVGSAPVPRVFLNTGHGHLGWSMAAGAGQLLADLIDEKEPAIDPTPYALARFASLMV